MNDLKIFSFFFLVFSSSVLSFDFFVNQNTNQDFFWHLKIPGFDFLPIQIENAGLGVKIAILDTFFCENENSNCFCCQKVFNMDDDVDFRKKLTTGRTFPFFNKNVEMSEENSLNLRIGCDFLNKLLKKNHGACVASLIRQIAPKVQIISIPILNDCAETSKVQFLQGLQQAFNEKIDILYLGLKLTSFNLKNELDQKILKLLKQFPYVVAASGNDGLNSSDIAFPARYIFFSVGAFEKKENNYLICDFSQFKENHGPNFVMPGYNLHCCLYDAAVKKNMTYCVSGTSMAAAIMTGCLANILWAGALKFTPKQVQYLMQKNSVKLNKIQWQSKVVFGAFNLKKSYFCVQYLQNLSEKISKKKFQNNFKKILDEFVQKIDMEKRGGELIL